MSYQIRLDQDRWNTLRNQPRVEVLVASQRGFTPDAEILNGRLAMVGFVGLLAAAVMARHGLFTAIGF
jgi:Chlorophyll A-B binding protein